MCPPGRTGLRGVRPGASGPVGWGQAVDLRYDQCVGMCECLPGRSVGDAQISAHFSCIPLGLHKPGWYTTEHE